MSILIKDFEMPKSCDVCPFVKTNDDLLSNDYRYMYCGFPYMGEYVTDCIAARHTLCPLREQKPAEYAWTSVKDGSPDKGDEYLVWIQYPFAEFPQYGIVPFDNCAGAFGEFVERYHPGTLGYIGEEFNEQKGVLAWMPLPEPPKGVKI